MPRLLMGILLLGALTFVATGSLAAQREIESVGRVVEVEVPAPALAGNLLGTPATQMAAVYLPPTYDSVTNRRYPVVYLLHGVFDDYGVWLENTEVQALLDKLVSASKIPEILVVMPNGGNKFGGGYYRNSPISGNWGDYIADDLIGYVDAHFRTLANEDSRAIVGHSMGGYGALHLVMTRPGLFSAVWALSPCCLAANDDLSIGNDAWKRAMEVSTPEDLQRLFEKQDFYPIVLLGIVSAFGPGPGTPPIYGEFPFEVVRGEVVLLDTAYDRFLDALPVRQVHDTREALRNLSGLAIDVGLGDQFLHIPTGALEFSQLLGKERIPHLLDVYAGDHRQLVAERLEGVILPWIGERLSNTD